MDMKTDYMWRWCYSPTRGHKENQCETNLYGNCYLSKKNQPPRSPQFQYTKRIEAISYATNTSANSAQIFKPSICKESNIFHHNYALGI